MPQSITWNKFYGGVSSDDKIVSQGQVLYAENINLKGDTDKLTMNFKPTTTVTTNTKSIYGFITVENSTQNLKDFGYGEDGVIYDVNGTNDTPNYTTTTGNDVVNALQFNGKVYFMQKWASVTQIKYAYITADDIYAGTGSLTEAQLDTSLFGTRLDKYPMYNYLDAYMYIGVGKSIFREDSSGVKDIFNLGTDEIIGITQLGGVFRLYQADGRILFWDGFKTNIDSSINIYDTISQVISHEGIDYIIGGISYAYSNFYYLNGYKAELIQKGVDTRITENPQSLRSSKFFMSGTNAHDIISFNGELLYINKDSQDSIYSFGREKIGLPIGFQMLTYLSPNDDDMTVSSLGKSLGGNYFYFGYSDGTHTGIGKYLKDYSISNLLATGSLILPLFDGGMKTKKKKIREIRVYGECSTSKTLTIKANINGTGFTTLATATANGRNEFYLTNDFYDIVFQIDFYRDPGLTPNYSNSPKFSELQLIYDIIED